MMNKTGFKLLDKHDERMKKNGRMRKVSGALVIAAILVTAGCGKKATPENLLTDMGKNLKDIKSMEAVMNLGLSMSDDTDSMEMNMSMDLQSTTDPQAAYINGDIDMNVSGMKIGTSIEAYQVKEDKKDVTYMKIMEQWMRTEADEEETAVLKQLETLKDFGDMADSFTLAEKTVKVEGVECFELTGTIKGETFAEVLKQDFLDSMGIGEIMDEKTIEKLEIPCTIDISKSDILPVKMNIDMKDTMGKAMESMYEGDEEISIEEYYMEIIYKDFDKVEEIAVPDEVKKAAVDEDLDLEDSLGAEPKTSKANLEPVEQKAELGENWDSFTVQVNDKILTFPCTFEDMEAAGLKLDEEFTPRDQKVEAGDYDFAYMIDDKGNMVTFELSNSGNEAKALEDCLVTGISVYDYSLEYGGLTVILPGGVQIGMEKDAVIEKYGETDDVYEGDYSHSYTWYDPVDYYKYCEIEFDSESGKVISMGLTCTEF